MCFCPWVWLTGCRRLSSGTTVKHRDSLQRVEFKCSALKSALSIPFCFFLNDRVRQAPVLMDYQQEILSMISYIFTAIFLSKIFSLFCLKFDHLGEKASDAFQHTVNKKLSGTASHTLLAFISSLLYIVCLFVSQCHPLFVLVPVIETQSGSWLSDVVPWCKQRSRVRNNAWHNLSSTEGMLVWRGLLKSHFFCSQHLSHFLCPTKLDCLFGL